MNMSNATINSIIEVEPRQGGLLEYLKGVKDFEANTALRVCDVLSLSEVKRSPQVGFELIEFAVNEGLYNQLIQDQLSILIEEGYVLGIDNFVEKVNHISNNILTICLKGDLALLQDYSYILEILCAKGLDVSKTLTHILRVLCSKVHHRCCDVDVIKNRMALTTYGTNQFNFAQKIEELDESARFIRKNKLHIMKGPMHYYYALFKDKHPHCSSAVYNDDSKHSAYWHIQKARSHMFPLAKLRADYY